MPSLCSDPLTQEPATVTCVTTAPFLKKMKVLKKFKRRMGLAGRPSVIPNLPPLAFHSVCGDNVRISADGKVARRVESFCKGIVFSNRPVKVGERLFLRLLEISSNWSGVVRFGFTCQDPIGLRDALPKYACPDLTNKPGYWAKALSERYAEQGLVLFYYVTSTGDVHFGINGEERGVFFSGVDTRSPIWSMMDVYGNSTGIEILDHHSQLNNRTRIVNDLSPGSSITNSRVLPQSQNPPVTSSTPLQNVRSSPPQHADVDRLQPSMAQLAIQQEVIVPQVYRGIVFTPFPFHRVKGRNVIFSNDHTVASRLEGDFSQGYVFTGRPLRFGEVFVIQVLETQPMYVGALAFGLTAANPAGLESSDLPEDCDMLLDRPDYWVVSKDVASSPVPGDELAFSLTLNGEVTYSKNGSSPQTVMHVDHSLQLWAFFDIYGNTSKIRCLGVLQESSPAVCVIEQGRIPSPVAVAPQIQGPLVVNLPPLPPTPIAPRPLCAKPGELVSGSATLSSTYSSTYMEPISVTSTVSSQSSCNFISVNHECTVCYEKVVDSVLYMCGHMCMCYECALQQWKGRGGGHCPICRAVIRDVIRTYRS